MSKTDNTNPEQTESDSQPSNRIEAELDDPRAGNHGTPVHARCISCKQVRVKRAPVDPDGKQSFKHVCHRCRRSTYWNVIRYLRDDDREQEDDR